MTKELDTYTAKVKRKLDRLAAQARGSRPTLLHWMDDELDARRGPFALDAVVASAILPRAVAAWEIGAIEGKRPEPITVGRALKALGCTRWEPTGYKFWVLPNVDEAEVKSKGALFWRLQNQRIIAGGDPRQEREVLITPTPRPNARKPEIPPTVQTPDWL